MRIRPSVQEDGGDIVYRGFDDESGVVTLQMQAHRRGGRGDGRRGGRGSGGAVSCDCCSRAAPLSAGLLRRLPVLLGHAQGWHREHAAPLHPGGQGGAREEGRGGGGGGLAARVEGGMGGGGEGRRSGGGGGGR